MALYGHPVAGAIAGGTVVGIDIAGLAGVFIYGTQSRKRERIEKAQMMTAQDQAQPSIAPGSDGPGRPGDESQRRSRADRR